MAINQKQTPLSNISTNNFIHFQSLFRIELITIIKDGRSVFGYPYNPFLQYVKYTKGINIAKGITNNVFLTKKLKIKPQQQHNRKNTQKFLPELGPLAPHSDALPLYLSTTESTENIDR